MNMLLKVLSRTLSCPSLLVPDVSSPTISIASSCASAGHGLRAHHKHHTKWQKRDGEPTPVLGWNHRSTRRYASVSGQPSKKTSGAAAGYTWPISVHPTPYEILAHPKKARYSKALFYELVKIYHPDRNHSAADSSISHHVRLERYRLVVAAHEILSDDAKRRAYDLYGAGWDGNRTMENAFRQADRSWREEPGNASRNATWEDWERWRRARDGEQRPQTPVFMSNELFVFVVCSFVIVGSFAQARRASTSSLSLVEMRDEKHAIISDDMRRRQDRQAPLNRHERVESFLRQRDSWNHALAGDSGHDSPS
ncbi:hypothetical protein F5Y14DRAFT_327159 [Nemania sp. NC0429]|nr:hypothetical protein F5Y14DRAFT_327159 [Nemania sp. NC0429]